MSERDCNERSSQVFTQLEGQNRVGSGLSAGDLPSVAQQRRKTPCRWDPTTSRRRRVCKRASRCASPSSTAASSSCGACSSTHDSPSEPQNEKGNAIASRTHASPVWKRKTQSPNRRNETSWGAERFVTWEAWFQQSETVIGPCCSMILYSACEASCTWSPKLASLTGRGPSFFAHKMAVANMTSSLCSARSTARDLNPAPHNHTRSWRICNTAQSNPSLKSPHKLTGQVSRCDLDG